MHTGTPYYRLQVAQGETKEMTYEQRVERAKKRKAEREAFQAWVKATGAQTKFKTEAAGKPTKARAEKALGFPLDLTECTPLFF